MGRHQGTAGVDALLFTADAEHHYVLRDVVMLNSDAAEQTVTLYVVTGSLAIYLVSLPIPSSRTFHQELRQALNAGDELHGYSGAASWAIHLTGYQLKL